MKQNRKYYLKENIIEKLLDKNWIAQTQIRAFIKISKPNFSKLIKGMENDGIIEVKQWVRLSDYLVDKKYLNKEYKGHLIRLKKNLDSLKKVWKEYPSLRGNLQKSNSVHNVLIKTYDYGFIKNWPNRKRFFKRALKLSKNFFRLHIENNPTHFQNELLHWFSKYEPDKRIVFMDEFTKREESWAYHVISKHKEGYSDPLIEAIHYNLNDDLNDSKERFKTTQDLFIKLPYTTRLAKKNLIERYWDKPEELKKKIGIVFIPEGLIKTLFERCVFLDQLEGTTTSEELEYRKFDSIDAIKSDKIINKNTEFQEFEAFFIFHRNLFKNNVANEIDNFLKKTDKEFTLLRSKKEYTLTKGLIFGGKKMDELNHLMYKLINSNSSQQNGA